MSVWEERLQHRLSRVGLPPAVRQYRFAADGQTAVRRRWAFDFAWPDQRLALEVEGGSWGVAGATSCPMCGQTPTGRHTRGSGFERDCVKYSTAAVLGWRVLRVTPAMIEDGRAIELAAEAFADADALERARFASLLVRRSAKTRTPFVLATNESNGASRYPSYSARNPTRLPSTSSAPS